MEQNNNRRGGRNTGGRGAQDGGRGYYYPRGGRNRGFTRRYANQPQEQYDAGDGSGRGEYYPRGGRNRGQTQRYANLPQEQHDGGGAGGQQVHRNPANPWQNSERSGANQQGRRWSAVASGQPVESVAQTQTALAGLQIQEPHQQEVHGSSWKEGAEGPYFPINRPDRGGTVASRPVSLLVNHFPVKFNPANSILRYDVDIVQDSTRPLKKTIPKYDLRLIQQQLCSDYPDRFPLLRTAYDGEKNIFSAVSLPAGSYTVNLFGRSYVCTIKYGSELNLSKLQDFLNRNNTQIPRDVLQALDVVMKANLFREKVSVGRGMYPRVHRREDDLGQGVAAFRGSQQSLKMTMNGLVTCSDYSAIPFRKRIPVIEFLQEHIREIRVVNDIGRWRSKVIAALKGLRVTVTHRRTNQKYIISGLTDQVTDKISFEQEDPEGEKPPETVKLTDYFRKKWEKEIVYKGIPCLKLGNGKKPNYVPMEFCVLAEDRRFPKEQLGRVAANKLKDLCLLPPDSRRGEICNLVREEYGTGSHGGEFVHNFEVGVGMNMTAVGGRVMPPPKLKLGSLSGKPNMMTVNDRGQWNFNHGKMFVSSKAVERWAVVDFSSADRRDQVDINLFIGNLMDRCRKLGVRIEYPLVVEQTNMNELDSVDQLRRLFTWVMEEVGRTGAKGRLELVVCVMASRHEGYKYLKSVAEIEIGVMTQCCLSAHANRASDQFFANLCLKINAKLGGSNMELVDRFPRFNTNDRFMFIGADVNHPAAFNDMSPSVAAVVGSVNWPAATRYAARVSPQSHRKEEIVSFGTMCLDLVNTFARENGAKPNKIVVFRDGVSDGQFEMVLNKEMVEMKKVIYTEHYRPSVTFVVAQKRHSTRLFLADESNNVPPGTVVDTAVVHPFEFDFYLCSHYGGMGTSKPTHYSVIWDEIGFSSDDMQKLIYHMCYIYARCTKPVSLVPPVYYADLVAYRGRMFQEVAAESGGRGSSAANPFDQFFYNLEGHLKDSMFFV